MVRGKGTGQNISGSTSKVSRLVNGKNNNGLFEITTKAFGTKPFQDDCQLGLQDENLDFEPEEEISDSFCHTQNSLQTSNTAERLWKSVDNGKSDGGSPATDYADSDSVLSSHRGEMIKIRNSYALDGRHLEYIKIPDVRITSRCRTRIDSSSSSGSDESTAISHQPSLYQEGNSASQECETSSQDGFYSQEFESTLQGDVLEYHDVGYDVTSDEEQRLLRSSSETSDQGEIQPCFRDMQIYISESKNFIITKKIRMWDRFYKPYPPPVRLFLEDIGYEKFEPNTNWEFRNEVSQSRPESAASFLSGSESAISVSSTPPVNPSSFRVTLNLSQGNRQVEKPIQSVIRSVSSGSLEQFKMPLPPAKRPPSRVKKSQDGSTAKSSAESSSIGSSCSSKIDLSVFKKKKKDEDTISIVASTLGGEDNLENPDNLDADLENAEYIKSETCSESVGDGVREDYFDNTYVRAYIENWIEKIPAPVSNVPMQQLSPPSLPTPLLPSPCLSPPSREVQPKEGTGGQLVAYAHGKMRINFKEIPKIFMGLCYFQYFCEGCTNRRCLKAHVVSRDKFSVKCKDTLPTDLLAIYKFALRFHKLFEDTYQCFVDGFSHHKMQNELFSCISDILSPSLKDVIDSTIALDYIIQALESTGLTFLDAIDTISYNVGFINYPQLADILVDLLSRRDAIATNWDTIKRISRARRHISPKIVERILGRVASVYPPNKSLCVDIYNFIVSNDMTDLSSVREELITPLRTLTMFGENNAGADASTCAVPIRSLTAHIEDGLSRERERFERSLSPGVFDHVSGEGSDDRIALQISNDASCRTPNSCVAPSSGSSNKSGGFGGYMSSPQQQHQQHQQEINTYVPQVAIRRNSGPSMFSPSEYSHPFSLPPHLAFSQPPPSLFTQPPPAIHTSSTAIYTSSTAIYTSSPATYTSPTAVPVPSQITQRPIFGTPRYRPTFAMGVSLHNLLPDSQECVGIHENDVVSLNDAIKNQKAKQFLRLLDNYKGPATVKSFVTMTVAHLKSLHDKERISEAIFGLLDSLSLIRPDYMKETHIKGILEVVVFNLLFFLEKRCNWRDARKLLEIFYDWDSLISSRMFANHELSTMGRYIFLAKLLVKDSCYHYAYEILQCPNLRLLDSVVSWPFFAVPNTDLDSRNAVLNDFFSVGYRHNVVVVAYMYRQVFSFKRIYDCDAQNYFNPMLIALINETKISSLKYFCAEVFYYNMDKNVLRAFAIVMYDHMTCVERLAMYEFCCRRDIYVSYSGKETFLFLRNNMPDPELKLIFDYYLFKVASIGKPPISDLRISIRLPDGPRPLYPALLQRSERSVSNLNDAIIKLTRSCYGITSIVDAENTAFMTIKAEEIASWLERMRA